LATSRPLTLGSACVSNRRISIHLKAIFHPEFFIPRNNSVLPIKAIPFPPQALLSSLFAFPPHFDSLGRMPSHHLTSYYASGVNLDHFHPCCYVLLAVSFWPQLIRSSEFSGSRPANELNSWSLPLSSDDSDYEVGSLLYIPCNLVSLRCNLFFVTLTSAEFQVAAAERRPVLLLLLVYYSYIPRIRLHLFVLPNLTRLSLTAIDAGSPVAIESPGISCRHHQSD